MTGQSANWKGVLGSCLLALAVLFAPLGAAELLPHKTLRGHTGPIGCVAFSPDGSLLASCGGGTVKLWNVAAEKAQASFKEHSTGVLRSRLHPRRQNARRGHEGDELILLRLTWLPASTAPRFKGTTPRFTPSRSARTKTLASGCERSHG